MPRWKALPDELDPQIREFTSQLRRLVDRSGLGIAAVSDQTGYSKTSWERYLNGRLLAPKGAIVALAEVTGTNPVHLTTMWELAERAWSRSEMRHDMTMEAIRISQARAALSEFGVPPANARNAKARKGGGATATPGVAGAAGVAPTVPAQPTGTDADLRDSGVRAAGAADTGVRAAGVGDTGVRDAGPRHSARPSAPPSAQSSAEPSASPESGVNSWNIAGYRGPAPTGGRRPGTGAGTAPGTAPTAAPGGPAGPAGPLGPAGPAAPAGAPRHAGAVGGPPRGTRAASSRGGGGRRTTMLLAAVVGVAIVAVGAFLYLNGGDKKNEGADPKPSPTPSTAPKLPPGVKCSGETCSGKDAEAMGCSGDLVTTATSATVGTTVVEVRYSKVCKAAWGRITGAAQGDEVKVTAGKRTETGTTSTAGDTIAYTPMVAVKDADDAVACATLAAAGTTGCTQ
ncbi:DUF2690 domain-containing protein [Streptomyces sp. NPDC096205]|uniref:DUF2690 domain-containing protein n=1 Tax=Streptomyces sp. NPDC096205 TaxID=3366081 RepID=UPI00381DDA1B